MEISCQLPFQFACDFTISDINVSGEYLYSIMWKEKLLPLLSPLTSPKKGSLIIETRMMTPPVVHNQF